MRVSKSVWNTAYDARLDDSVAKVVNSVSDASSQKIRDGLDSTILPSARASLLRPTRGRSSRTTPCCQPCDGRLRRWVSVREGFSVPLVYFLVEVPMSGALEDGGHRLTSTRPISSSRSQAGPHEF
ncbi:hypothetical protein HBH53_231690 [Parastagonospora nodorum]|nr:hypothetical protein HBH53_231690 [Parastagonospora nodorum]